MGYRRRGIISCLTAERPAGGSDHVGVDLPGKDPDGVAAAALKDNQHVDILVNDAGYLGKTTEFVSHAPSDWQQIVPVNLLGTMHVTQAILPVMIRQRAERIINLGSLAGM